MTFEKLSHIYGGNLGSYYILKQKSDVFHSMKSFFKQEQEKAAK